MKILYGIQGTGNGHISRGREIAHYFEQKGVDVTYLISGREKDKLFDMSVFGDYQHRRGLTFVTENGRINQIKTVTGNNIFSFIKDVYALNLDSYDLIISDFEPITAWAAKLKSKTSLGIGHQYAFGKETPSEKRHLLEKVIMKSFAPTQYRAGLHWHPFGEGVFPSIIDTQLQQDEIGESYLVYLPFEDQTVVTHILNELVDYQFKQYSPDLVDEQRGNVSLRKTCHVGFKQDLRTAKGVICNAGFELISECLHLGLPILAKPLAGQIEQLSNAKALEQLSYAATTKRLNKEVVEAWLKRDKQSNKRPMPKVTPALVDWLLTGQWQDSKAVIDKLWGMAPWHKQS